MKKQIFLFSALAAVLISGCAVAGNNADDTKNQTVIGTAINEEDNDTKDVQDTEDSNKDDAASENVDTDDTSVADADVQNGDSDATVIDNTTANSAAGFTAFGHYADMQGTEDIYSDIYITENSDKTISVEMGIFRLTNLKGEGYETEDANVLNFVGYPDANTDSVIKGTLEYSDNGVVFTVTESEWSLLNAGEEVVFGTALEF